MTRAAGGGSAGGYLSAATLLVDFVNAKTDPPGVSAKPNALVLFNPGFGAPQKEPGEAPRDPEGKGELKQYVKPNLPPMIQFFGAKIHFCPAPAPSRKPTPRRATVARSSPTLARATASSTRTSTTR